MKSLKAVDILLLLYIFFTSVLIFLGWNQIAEPFLLLFKRMAIVFICLVVILLNRKFGNPFISLIRETYPLIASGYFYSETVFFNKLFFNDLDPLLEQLEFNIFKSQPSLVFSEWISSTLFSELMYFAYFSFYLMIFGFALLMFYKLKEEGLKNIFLLSSSLYLFYLLFSLFPSAGPQFYYDFPENSLPEAYVFDQIMHFVQKVGEQPTGAFPSSHVGVSLIILILTRKPLPKIFNWLLPLTLLLFLSTVYIKAHYLIDVFVGIIIAPFILLISQKAYSIFEKMTI